LLRVKRKIELDARLAAAILHILTGVKGSSQLLKQGPGNLKVALVVRLIRSILAIINPKRSTIRTVLGLLGLLRLLVGVHQ
jgi:hypothetical protein